MCDRCGTVRAEVSPLEDKSPTFATCRKCVTPVLHAETDPARMRVSTISLPDGSDAIDKTYPIRNEPDNLKSLTFLGHPNTDIRVR